jgi:hypothetical protein
MQNIIFCYIQLHLRIALKVLSSEMDPAQIRLIPLIFIKGSVEALTRWGTGGFF